MFKKSKKGEPSIRATFPELRSIWRMVFWVVDNAKTLYPTPVSDGKNVMWPRWSWVYSSNKCSSWPRIWKQIKYRLCMDTPPTFHLNIRDSSINADLLDSTNRQRRLIAFLDLTSSCPSCLLHLNQCLPSHFPVTHPAPPQFSCTTFSFDLYYFLCIFHTTPSSIVNSFYKYPTRYSKS